MDNNKKKHRLDEADMFYDQCISYLDKPPFENNKLQLFNCLSLSTNNYVNINIHEITKVADTLLIKIEDNFCCLKK